MVETFILAERFYTLANTIKGMTRRLAMSSGQVASSQLPIAKDRLPLTDHFDKKAEFKRWLALFFIERGKYKITEKGYAELAPQLVRQDTHFGEDNAAKERSTKREIARPLTRKEIKEAVAAKVEALCREGKSEGLLDEGHLAYKADWKEKGTRVTVIKKLLEFLGASPAKLDELRKELNELILKAAREEKTDTKRMQEVLDEIRRNFERIRRITADDFNNVSLGGGLLSKYYNSSIYLALVEAGYAYSEDELRKDARTGQFRTDKLYPWEMTRIGNWVDKENRIAAIKWLVWKTKKDPREITKDDFRSSGLEGLVAGRYKGSNYKVLVEAGYAYSEDEIKEHAKTGFKNDKIYPWEMNQTSSLIYKKSENRIAATKWLVWKLNKDPREITQDDFNNNGLGGLIARPECVGSPYLILVEAGYAYSEDEIKEHAKTGFKTDKIYPWEMNHARVYYKRGIRIASIRWLIWRLKKKAREITFNDFNNNGLGGLMPYYKSSPYEALLEAGLVTPADEAYMRSSHHTH